MKDIENIDAIMDDMGMRARAAAAELAFASAERKHAALIGAAEAVWRRRAEIMEANEKDMVFGPIPTKRKWPWFEFQIFSYLQI